MLSKDQAREVAKFLRDDLSVECEVIKVEMDFYFGRHEESGERFIELTQDLPLEDRSPSALMRQGLQLHPDAHAIIRERREQRELEPQA